MSQRSSRPSLVQRQWRKRGWLATLLRPLSALTAFVVSRKRNAYRNGKRPVHRVGVPVIVVGNIYVGGTGKTPVVTALVHALQARGWKPGVVSRGYGAKVGRHPRVGQGDLAADQYGDEPALISRTACVPVSVHPQRVLAARALLRQYPDINVIVSDDGLQHLALARDIEIVVQDERGVGNGLLLPAGPLREPATRLLEVDAIITNRGHKPAPLSACDVVAGNPRRVDMWLAPEPAWNLCTAERRVLADFARTASSSRIAAAAGIGNPERFFQTLRAAGVPLAATLPLPDHYDYARSPFDALHADLIFITAKDAIKCAWLRDPRLWVVPVCAQFSDPVFFDWLNALLKRQ